MSEQLREAAKAALAWWEEFVGNGPFDQEIEDAEWKEFKNLRAALAASPEGLARPQTEEKPDSGWQPIESAPKMRSVILWADTSTPDFPNWHMGSGHFSTDLNAWIWEGETVREWAHPPTHWMPLPKPPAGADQELG